MKPARDRFVKIRFIVLAAFALCAVAALVSDLRPVSYVSAESENGEHFALVSGEPEPQDYRRFRHGVPEHSSLPCLLCHKRNDNSPTMKFSGHLPCAGCHVEQFKDNKSPLCYICHTETGLKRFPPLRSFGVRFSHAVHTRQTNCATCHKQSRRGVAFSIPQGGNGHVTCFQCHKPDMQAGGSNIGSCNVCHQAGRPPRNNDWAKAFTVNFNHSEHGASRRLSCTSCHTVAGKTVVSPAPAMHFPPRGKSCATCHDNSRAFGGTDFNDCRRCHEGGKFAF